MSSIGRFLRSQAGVIFGLCAFLAFLSFQPSEPYLSEYLVCNKDTQEDYCSDYSDESSCNQSAPCAWTQSATSSAYFCGITTCSNVSHDDCGNSDYSYCEKDSDTCKDAKCYKNFSEDEVNDEIYPWSTYAYLPFLLLLGPWAELFSYRIAILVGISGRPVTRFLLLYGRSMRSMQLMQIAYAFGTAAEDVLAAYLFYTLSPAYYQIGTSYLKATSLATNVVAGVVGDLLAVEGGVSLRVLMWISAVSVCMGFCVGIVVLRPAPAAHPRGREPGIITNDDAEGESAIDHSPLLDTTVEQSWTETVKSESQATSQNSAESEPGAKPKAPCTQQRGLHHKNNSSSTTSTTPASSATVQEKLRQFRQQLGYLCVAFRSSALAALVGYWVVGNGVFMTLYDYEVAVYAELHGGSNEWNGSVLAVMLLLGTIGALLPTWLKHDVYINETDRKPDPAASSTRTFTTTPAFVVGIRVVIAGVLSCVNLLLFVISWEVVASVCFLALFFATWQYINVVCFARIALALKIAQLEHGGASSAQDSGFSAEADSRPHSIDITETSAPFAGQNAALYGERTFSAELYNPMQGTATTRYTAVPRSGEWGKSQEAPVESDSFPPRSLEDIPEPPYSVALVSIVALNVLVQIILQAITFSGLALPLRDSCWIFVLTFCAATGVYILCLLCLFGTTQMRRGLTDVFAVK